MKELFFEKYGVSLKSVIGIGLTRSWLKLAIYQGVREISDTRAIAFDPPTRRVHASSLGCRGECFGMVHIVSM